MVCIRKATIDDLLAMQACNLFCLPENYQMEEERNKCHGHITSLAVFLTHRKLGFAIKLMSVTQNAMEHVFAAKYVSFILWGYKIHNVEAKYYADREDALDMRNELKGKKMHEHNLFGINLGLSIRLVR
ncbi:unnamed protein product [Malus baccata var. baccata]